MKRIVVFILTAVGFFDVTAQSKPQKTFTMPEHAEYVRGRVLVKIKEEYKDEVSQLVKKKSAVLIKKVELNSISHVVKPESSVASVSVRAKKPIVDVSKYFSLGFDTNQDVESLINQLYSTGYFEIVEPDYVYKTGFIPSDPTISQQYYLSLINAFDAWDITKGDTSIVIAIVDTGGNLTHPDLAPNLYRNWSEYPPNGVDDDHNGFVDDYQGWDFIGTKVSNLEQADYDPATYGDNDPSIAKGGDIAHGTMVGGCASAATNNGKGIAGVGYKTKLLFTKQSGDDQLTTQGSEYNVYSAMYYAADLFERHGIRGIINCSFGGAGRSQIYQELINHIVIDKNCLIVAAAGNEGSSDPSYPAGYDNVLSVAACDKNNKKASFTNIGTTVDITAPGVAIYTTTYKDNYVVENGTSFSCPITSGAAALVWSKNPTFSAIQVGEQLRVTADASSLYLANPGFKNQLGKGRLDISKALTLELPSIRASNPRMVNQKGFAAVPGDKAYLTFNFTNHLKSTSGGIQISISTKSTAVTISNGTIAPGIIEGGATITNKVTPFELTIKSLVAQNTPVDILITYSDGLYSDYEYASFLVNPSFIDVNSNLIGTTVSGIGRIGYQDPEKSAQGMGFTFGESDLLYEMGLIMGTDSTTHFYNNVRGVSGLYDQDFSSTVDIKQIVPGQRSYSEVYGEFSNSTLPANQGVVVGYRSMVMKDAPYDKFVILEYKVKNPTLNPLNNFYFGIFADWDISDRGQLDAAYWDSNNKLGYVYTTQTSTNLPYAGIQLLTDQPGYYAIDNDASKAGGNSFGLYDGFTHYEKFKAISASIGSGNERLQTAQSSGDDVSHVVSSGPHDIAAGQTITIAFALHAAAKFSDLQTSARYADSLYNYTIQATKPIADSVITCYGSQATFNAGGATKIKWYKSFTGGQSFYTGPQYVINNLKNDTVFYVSNADHSYESVRTAVVAEAKANPKISASGSTTLCEGDMITLSVAPADSTIWNTKEKTNTITVSTAGKYAVLSKDKTLSCSSKSDTVYVVVNPKPTADFTFAGDLTKLPTSFTDLSTDAVTWFWDFGDGQNSSDQNPNHTFATASNSVKLTVTAANGCSASKTESVALITAVEPSQLTNFAIYPNPVANQDLRIVIDNEDMNEARLVLTNSIGQVILERDISTTATHVEVTIPSTSLNQGLNFIKANVGGTMITKKVVKVQ